MLDKFYLILYVIQKKKLHWNSLMVTQKVEYFAEYRLTMLINDI